MSSEQIMDALKRSIEVNASKGKPAHWRIDDGELFTNTALSSPTHGGRMSVERLVGEREMGPPPTPGDRPPSFKPVTVAWQILPRPPVPPAIGRQKFFAKPIFSSAAFSPAASFGIKA